MGKVRAFKLNGGTHEQEGTMYRRGQVIKTELDLIAMFGDKFVEVHPSTPSATPAPLIDPATEDLAAVQAAAKVAPGENAAEKAREVEKVTSVLGEDVSDQFPSDISDNDFAVIKKGKKFFLVDRDLPDEAVNKEEVLRSPEEVLEFAKAKLS